MGVIGKQLGRMNELGYLTINSQPAVNGARSSDPTHGWGPANGYVYQKVCALYVFIYVALTVYPQAYLEFFVSAAQLTILISRISRDPNVTYYAINDQGDLRTNNNSEGPNAVTWGVFPGKEIVQPTIVEAVSFMAWKVGFLVLLCRGRVLKHTLLTGRGVRAREAVGKTLRAGFQDP